MKNGNHLRPRAIHAAIVAGGLLAAYIAVVVYGNRMRNEVRIEKIGAGAPERVLTEDTISLMTWNLGYGGLGAESDFTVDGGKNFLPPSRKIVNKNVAGIAAELAASAQDVVILQETARPSLLTRGADIVGAIAAALDGRDNAFSADFAARFLPGYSSRVTGFFPR